MMVSHSSFDKQLSLMRNDEQTVVGFEKQGLIFRGEILKQREFSQKVTISKIELPMGSACH